jgi:hypothetical protein
VKDYVIGTQGKPVPQFLRAKRRTSAPMNPSGVTLRVLALRDVPQLDDEKLAQCVAEIVNYSSLIR